MIPVGLCGCGCGSPTPIADRNHARYGHVKGQPIRFVLGHAGARRTGPVQSAFKKPCAHCGRSFKTFPYSPGKYCGRRCYFAVKRLERGACLHCGAEVKIPSHKYCSWHCWTAAVVTPTLALICETCWAVFRTPLVNDRPSRSRFCSVACGKVDPSYFRRGTRVRQPEYIARAQKTLQRAIRSGRVSRPTHCEECGVDCKPDGHHDNYGEPLAVRWLCRSCHFRFHYVQGDALGVVFKSVMASDGGGR